MVIYARALLTIKYNLVLANSSHSVWLGR